MYTQKISTPQPGPTPNYADMIATIKEGQVATAKHDREVGARAIVRLALDAPSEAMREWLMKKATTLIRSDEIEEFKVWRDMAQETGRQAGIRWAVKNPKTAKDMCRHEDNKREDEAA